MTNTPVHMRAGVAFLATLMIVPSVALAQDDEGFFDSFGEAIAASMAPRWVGPRVPWPAPALRPRSAGALTSSLHPVSVHAASDAAHAELVGETLVALERAHVWLTAHGWPTPHGDAGEGGTAGFDLYLVDEIEGPQHGDDDEGVPMTAWAREGYDTPTGWTALDGVVTHARMDVDVDPLRLEACVTSAYVRASLLSLDPAEAESWRAATGDFVAWLVTGFFGCSDEPIVAQQRASSRTWIGDDAARGGGGALFLAMLSARTDGLTGDFVRDVWSGAPQITWDGEGLRAAPDVWQVLHTVMQAGRDPLPRLLEEMAVTRYFAGEHSRLAGAPLAFLRELPADAAVPLVARARWEQLPRRFEPRGLELEPLGSAYLLVDTADAPAGSVLRVWLRGEVGVGWALSTVRLGADGLERGRVRAPVRPRTPRSFIPLELTDTDTKSVLIVVTNMGARLVDADTPNDQVRAFRIVLDKIEPDPPDRAP